MNKVDGVKIKDNIIKNQRGCFYSNQLKLKKKNHFQKPMTINKLIRDLGSNQNQAFRFHGNSQKYKNNKNKHLTSE